MKKRLVCLQAILVLCAAPQTAPANRKYGYGAPDALKWLDPDHSDLGDLKFKTFHSGTIEADVSYMIYLPPDYGQDTNARYPVLYQLPASGGTPRRDGPQVTIRIDKAIRAKRIGPMIVVAVNGLAGNTMYSDTHDGQYPLETVIIKGRLRRGAPGVQVPGRVRRRFDHGAAACRASLSGLPAQAWGRLFPTAMDGDMEYWKSNNPFDLAAKNADKLRDRTFIRIVAHSESGHWLAPQCEKLHKILVDHMIQHEYSFLVNVKSHNPIQCMDTLGDAAFSFFSSSLAQRPQSARIH